MTDETCAELAKLVNMARLDLRYCPLTNAGIAQVSQRMPRLEYCNVEGCRLTCLGMLALMRQHKHLRVWGPGTCLKLIHANPPCSGPIFFPASEAALQRIRRCWEVLLFYMVLLCHKSIGGRGAQMASLVRLHCGS